jgi:hypothetical protein
MIIYIIYIKLYIFYDYDKFIYPLPNIISWAL